MVDIIGSWVTSFNNWLQSNEQDLLQLFRIVNNRLIGWSDPIVANDRYEQEYFTRKIVVDSLTGEEKTVFTYWDNPATQDFLDEYKFLQVLNPVPTATLSFFKFEDEKYLSLWVRFNDLSGMQEYKMVGEYNCDWDPDTETWGGIITLREPLDPPLQPSDPRDPHNADVHATLTFLLVSPDEMNFIMAYKNDPLDPAPSGAGTMRRVNVPKK